MYRETKMAALYMGWPYRSMQISLQVSTMAYWDCNVHKKMFLFVLPLQLTILNIHKTGVL